MLQASPITGYNNYGDSDNTNDDDHDHGNNDDDDNQTYWYKPWTRLQQLSSLCAYVPLAYHYLQSDLGCVSHMWTVDPVEA